MSHTPMPPAATTEAPTSTISVPLIVAQQVLPTQAADVPVSKPRPEFDLRHFIDEVLGNLTVAQIYSDPRHKFKVSGNRSRGGCIIHNSESGTSFVVSEDSKLFWCEGCQRGGSAIDYIHSRRIGRWDKPRGRDFIETVKELAALAGMSLPERILSPEEIEVGRKWESRRDILRSAAEYGEEMLWSDAGIAAREYLTKERRLTEDAIRNLGLGYYHSRQDVQRFLLAKGHSLEDCKAAGILWSKLVGYILFPWYDSRGRMLTIYGRFHTKAAPAGRPKTIAVHGDDTKGSPLYLDRALQAGHKDIVLVEGVLDAALLQVSGDTRVCAYVAAACSNLQIETLRRAGIKSVTLCGDPDNGGLTGTNSNLKRLTEVGIKVFVAPKLPDGLDPDEFLLREGIDGWMHHIESAVHGYTWKARTLISAGVDTDKERQRLLIEAINFAESVVAEQNKLDLKVFFWPEICNALGVNPSEFLSEETINRKGQSSDGSGGGNGGGDGSSGDGSSGSWSVPEENDWGAPVSWLGEIGYLHEDFKPKVERNAETGEMRPVVDAKGKPVLELVIRFIPRCNFDFQIEREFSSSDGGGVILQVLRSSDHPSEQKRVFIKSLDYTEVARFVDALKKVLGSGICCNLKKEALNALIHVRTREYRSNGGKIFKLAERMGRQEDGTWVFEDLQFTSKGNITTEEQSGWCFNANLGGEDRIPSPAIAPPDPSALPNLVAAMARFHGPDGILPAMISLGYGAASAHYQEVMRVEKHFLS